MDMSDLYRHIADVKRVQNAGMSITFRCGGCGRIKGVVVENVSSLVGQHIPAGWTVADMIKVYCPDCAEL